MNITQRLKQINAGIDEVLNDTRTNLVDELRAIKKEIDALIEHNADSVLITEFKAKSTLIPKQDMRPWFDYEGWDGREHRVLNEHVEFMEGHILEAGTEIMICGSVIMPIANKVLAVPKDIPEFIIEEPVVLAQVLELTANNAVLINGVKVLYTRVGNAIDPLSHLFGAEHCYTIDNEVDEFVTAIFKHDHIQLMVNEGNRQYLSPAMDLIVRSLDMTEKERKRIALEAHPDYYAQVDAYYADQKEKARKAAEAVLQHIEDEGYPELHEPMDTIPWYKRFINYLK